MTTIPPSTPILPTLIPVGPGMAAVLTQLPAELQAAGQGTTISGTVVAIDSQGQILLQTSAGVVGFQSQASFSVGQQVTLQVQSTGAQARAIVLAVEAQVMTELASAESAAPAPDAPAAGAATPAATVAPSVTTGSVVIATVITSAPSPSAGSSAPTTAGAASSSSPPSSTPAAAGAAAAPTPPAAASGTLPAPTAATTSAAATTAATPAPAATLPGAVSPPLATPSPVPAQITAPSSPAAVGSQPGAAMVAQAPTASTTAPATAAPVPSPSAALGAQAAAPPRAVAMAIASYAASSASGASNVPSTPAPPSSGVPLPTPPPGTQIPLRFVGPLPNLAAAAAGAQSGQLVATVVARTPAGQTIIDTAVGRLALAAFAAESVAIGSQIAFEIAAPALRPPLATLPGNPALAAGRSLATLANEWPALKDALSTLATINPELARQVMETALPQLGNPRFVAQVLSFLATSATDVKTLLGQATLDALQQAGHGDIAARLQADLSSMNRLNASATDWRVFYVPLLDSTEVRQLRVFTRRRKAGADWTRDSGRFVVDVEFEHLGPLQLDGLVQKPRLDLILRSHAELPNTLRSGISDVFTQTCEAAGLSGHIFFQALPSFPVSPLDEMTTSSARDLSV